MLKVTMILDHNLANDMTPTELVKEYYLTAQAKFILEYIDVKQEERFPETEAGECEGVFKTNNIRIDSMIACLFQGRNENEIEQCRERFFDEIESGLTGDDKEFIMCCSSEHDGAMYSISYKTRKDVPTVDVPCPCGNPNHWLIKHEIIDSPTE